MSTNAEFDRQLEENRRAYEALRDEIRIAYADQYVGIAFGKIVAVDPDYSQVCSVVDSLVPRAEHHLVFLGRDDPGFDEVICTYQGDFLPWDEPVGNAPPTDGTPSISPSAPSPND